MVRATALYPFVPSGANFLLAIDFFTAIGFEKQWENSGLAALRFGSAFPAPLHYRKLVRLVSIAL